MVGNSNYQNLAPLDNPRNDATLMADTLTTVVFELIGGRTQINLDKASFDRVIQGFGDRRAGADVGLFYYGHGVQVRSSNYMVPVSANPTKEADADFSACPIRWLGVVRARRAEASRRCAHHLDEVQ